MSIHRVMSTVQSAQSTMKSAIAILLLFSATCVSAFAATSTDFHTFVPSLSSDSESIRTWALEQLKKIPPQDLDAQLKADLQSPHPNAALKVIRTLQQTSSLESVMSLAHKHPSTETYETLRSLLTPQNQNTISSLISQQLASDEAKLTSGAVIVGLEILSLSSVDLPVTTARHFLTDKSYEVRIALVSYLRGLIKEGKTQPYLPLISDALVSSPYQLRLEAIEVAELLSKTQLSSLSSSLTKCSSDQNPEVQQKCKALIAKREGS